jgi:hypothetical protein
MVYGGNLEDVVNDSLKEATNAHEDKETQTLITTTLTCATCKYFVKITCFANYSWGLCGE